MKKIIAPRALTGVKLGCLIKGDMCKGNFWWWVEGTHEPGFPQITLRFSAEVVLSQKQTAKNNLQWKKSLQLRVSTFLYIKFNICMLYWNWKTKMRVGGKGLGGEGGDNPLMYNWVWCWGGHGVHVLQNKRVAYYSCSTSFSNPLTWHTQLPELHSHLHEDMYTSTLWSFLLCFQLQPPQNSHELLHPVEHTFTPTPTTPSPIPTPSWGEAFKYRGEVLILRASPPPHLANTPFH